MLICCIYDLIWYLVVPLSASSSYASYFDFQKSAEDVFCAN